MERASNDIPIENSDLKKSEETKLGMNIGNIPLSDPDALQIDEIKTMPEKMKRALLLTRLSHGLRNLKYKKE